MTEIWKDVPGYEGIYQASSLGRIKALKRRRVTTKGTVFKKATPERVLSPSSHNFGYLHVDLTLGGKSKTWLIQHIIAATFIGPRPDGLLVCHNDGNPVNNTVGNLRYDTQSSNMLDRVKHGTSNRGSRHGLSKLSDLQLEGIRQELSVRPRIIQRRIAEKYGVSPSLITMIKKGEVRAYEGQ